MTQDKRLVKEGSARSFGRVASRMSPEAQKQLETRIEPFLFDPKNLPKAERITLEIGMGNGMLLFERAKANPDQLFLGIEVYKNGLRSLVSKCEKEGVTNLKISNQDAREILEDLPTGIIDQVCLLYPDPWPKRRQHKRRIVNQDFLKAVYRVLKEDGEYFMATDIPSYLHHMIAHVHTFDLFEAPAVKPQDWGTPPKWWISTKYEKKAYKEGRFPWYLTFHKREITS
ncbi:MAG: tRNA (guanosine(46)-N7)-methyltransferase TrmB [Alphaproteobacteria bacterium]|nr:tRNA (guanosine(46)-N7)-methyltransferase TrmB [Alphaproteobacteria bacterium]